MVVFGVAKLVPWLFQLAAAGILLPVSIMKITGNANSIYLFGELNMEPTGRFIIGVLELLAVILLLTKRLAASGALLAMAIMFGALIAHITVLGWAVQEDGGRMVWMLLIVLLSSTMVAYLRRGYLPFIGG